MKLILEFKVENIFKAKDFEKEGEPIKIGKWKLQGFSSRETAEGKQMSLVDVSVPDEVAYKLKEQVGKTVSIEVGTFINNGRVGFYGL